MEIRTEILINSTPDKVWEILTDFENYPNWNPFIKSIEGDMNVGKTIEVTIEPMGEKAMVFSPKILTIIKNKELSWLGHLLIPGIFDGKHKFEIIYNDDNTITLVHSEVFRGLLVPFFTKKLNNGTKKGFIAMNKKIKELAEQIHVI